MRHADFSYLENQLTEGFHLLQKKGEVEFICTNKVVHHGAQIDDLNLVSDEEAADHVKTADFVLFASAGDFEFNSGISGKLINDGSIKRKAVFVDGHDGNGWLDDPSKYLLYAKREVRYPEAIATTATNIRSLTFGIYQFLIDNAPPIDYDCRDIDISFIAFGGSNPVRSQLKVVIDNLKKNNPNLNVVCNVDNTCQPLSIDEYRSLMRRTKVGLSVIGAGFDTLRFWETMAHGAVLASCDIIRSILLRDAPEPHRHVIYFDTWGRMVELALGVVLDKRRWQHMRAATDKLIKCHTTVSRARTLVEMAAELV